ncbi:MAG: hypothetical protein H6765_07490 [Candidatus Peribacteria bacterium]|nr:MAG: hypothetical protein H6765_07490 [Candidatus Peribacteria bacterium]
MKRGRVVTEQDLAHELADVELVGSADMELAKLAKRQFAPRRYKTFKLLHTDKEVSTKGKELVAIGDGQIGIVDGWQDIDRYEVIDFGKPVRGMEIGMMPAKLTQTLVNIGVSQVHKVHDEDVSLNTTIYDPFCGFGTTLFVANSL